MIAYKGKSLKQRQIAKKKNRKSKIEARPVNDGHYMAFKQRWSLHGFHLRPIWLQFLVAIDSESCQRSFPSFCALLLPMLCWSAATRAQLLILQSTFDFLLEQPSEVIANELQRLKLEIKLNSVA